MPLELVTDGFQVKGLHRHEICQDALARIAVYLIMAHVMLSAATLEAVTDPNVFHLLSQIFSEC